jgi:predicted alpha/beta hydrolase family esterase
MVTVQSEQVMQVNSALMIHGAGGGGWEWDVWRRMFVSAGWCVSTPDLQPVAAGLEATTLDDYEAQVHDWMHAARPGVVIGASLGGLLAMRCHHAANAPLVLVNPMPPGGLPNVPVQGKRYPDRLPWRRGASLHSTAASLPDAEASTWHIAWRRWRDESGAVMNTASTGVSIERPRAKTLIVISEWDDDVPASTSRALAEALGADILDCAGASHVGPLLGRAAADMAERVLAWLRLRS